MARIKEYPSITSFDGTNDALAIEQTDGANNRLRKVSPAQLKQYMEAGDFEATGEIIDGHGNKLADMATNALDNPIDIKNYTSSNRYRVPKDGYIRYRVRSGESGGCTIYGSNQSNSGYLFGYIITAAHDTREIIFVKKGMYVQNDGAYALEYVGLS